MDSCSVMRGSKSGLEKRLRNSVAPHLPDNDGDICPHIHNIVKKFTTTFGNFLEKLLQDIFRDFHLSSDLLQHLKEICYYLGLTFRVRSNYISVRWLLVYDACMEFLYLRDAYHIFYHSFTFTYNSSSRKKKVMDRIFKKLNLSHSSQEEIKKIQLRLSKKEFTTKGKERKSRVVETLLFNKKNVSLVSSFYEAVLPVFKSFIMCFQSAKPLIHKVYYRQIELFQEFLSYFVKPSVLGKCSTGKSLMNLQITDDNILSKSMVFVGQKVKKIIQSLKSGGEVVTEFLTHIVTAYKTCGQYPQTKLPLRNQTLKSLPAIDPEFILSQNVDVLNHLLGLPDLLVHVLNGNEEHEGYNNYIHKLMQDNTLPACKDANDNEVDVAQWWSSISTKYP